MSTKKLILFVTTLIGLSIGKFDAAQQPPPQGLVKQY